MQNQIRTPLEGARKSGFGQVSVWTDHLSLWCARSSRVFLLFFKLIPPTPHPVVGKEKINNLSRSAVNPFCPFPLLPLPSSLKPLGVLPFRFETADDDGG